MKAEQQVKKIYPKAYAHRTITSDDSCFWHILSQRGIETVLLGDSAHRESWAWADALRRLKADFGVAP